MNVKERLALLEETKSKSRMIPDAVCYAVGYDNGAHTEITTDQKRVWLLISNGAKVFFKYLNGKMTL